MVATFYFVLIFCFFSSPGGVKKSDTRWDEVDRHL
ncbi:hypothetical protein NP493_228g00049 [Ridgeia piscesae]|uniref:Uncharacterized protein n=1 Tax=Ridgeia piscesae TaxID=27915 RepID=A0AAD9UDP3_RIDPI|nr:hypothetical protein NP493_228g00049 [Ridgeia piscesae]